MGDAGACTLPPYLSLLQWFRLLCDFLKSVIVLFKIVLHFLLLAWLSVGVEGISLQSLFRYISVYSKNVVVYLLHI
jgi:hypothetical protein